MSEMHHDQAPFSPAEEVNYQSIGNRVIRCFISKTEMGAVVLPEGYFFTDTMTAQELAELWDASGLHPGITPEGATEGMTPESEKETFRVSIRAKDNKLVGTGSIQLPESSPAYHGGLAVHPEHQHRGIGKAIVATNINIAERAGASIFTILKSTNTLTQFYEENGFEKIDEPTQYDDGFYYMAYFKA